MRLPHEYWLLLRGHLYDLEADSQMFSTYRDVLQGFPLGFVLPKGLREELRQEGEEQTVIKTGRKHWREWVGIWEEEGEAVDATDQDSPRQPEQAGRHTAEGTWKADNLGGLSGGLGAPVLQLGPRGGEQVRL